MGASAALNDSLEGLVRVLNTSGPAQPYTLHSASDIERRTESELGTTPPSLPAPSLPSSPPDPDAGAAVDYVKRVVSALPKVQAPPPGIVLNEKNLTDALMAAVHEIADATQKLITSSAQAEKARAPLVP